MHCQIHQLTFSPHTDAKGIMDLVKFLSPKHVILVHGEKPRMATLKGRIQSELGIPCYYPANNETVSIPSTHYATAVASDAFVRSCSNPNFKFSTSSSEDEHGSTSRNKNSIPRLQVTDDRVAQGILVMEKNKKAKVVHQDELLLMLGEEKHQVKFAYCCPAHIGSLQEHQETESSGLSLSSTNDDLLQLLSAKLANEFSEGSIHDFGEHLQVESFHVSICLKENCPYRLRDVGVEEKSEAVFFCCSWEVEDEKLAWKIISLCQNFDLHNKQGPVAGCG